MQSEINIRTKFLKAVESDTPLTKLWKYRALIVNYPV